MKKGMKIGIGLILGVMLISIVIPLNARAGSVSNIKVYSEVSGNRFSVNAKWDEDGYIDVEGKLYHNSIIIIESEANYYIGDTNYLTLYDNTLESGTYRFQLWSNTDDKELFAKSWDVPKLAIRQTITNQNGDVVEGGSSVTMDGQIGSMFISTTELSIESGGPDSYRVDGVLTLNFNDVSIEQNINNWISNRGYYEYYGIDDYTIEPVFASTIFGLPGGSYAIQSEYSNQYIQLTSGSINVYVNDQYQPIIDDLEDDVDSLEKDLSDTNKELNTTNEELVKAKSDVASLLSKINSLWNEISNLKNSDNSTGEKIDDNQNVVSQDIKSVKEDSEGYTGNVMYMAIGGIVLALIGIIVGFIAISKAKKGKKPPVSDQHFSAEPKTHSYPEPSHEPQQQHTHSPPSPHQRPEQKHSPLSDSGRPPPRPPMMKPM